MSATVLRCGSELPLKARRLAAVLLLLSGIPVGVGLFTFGYAKGFSYLSTDPRACVNCHIMNPQYDAWIKSGHRHSAGCVDCHLPHSGLEKWIAKADAGFRHSAAFTLQNFKEPIEITPGDRQLVLENCLRCHGDFVEALRAETASRGSEVDCLHCHAGVGHSARG